MITSLKKQFCEFRLNLNVPIRRIILISLLILLLCCLYTSFPTISCCRRALSTIFTTFICTTRTTSRFCRYCISLRKHNHISNTLNLFIVESKIIVFNISKVIIPNWRRWVAAFIKKKTILQRFIGFLSFNPRFWPSLLKILNSP